jgi:hypothetical protein
MKHRISWAVVFLLVMAIAAGMNCGGEKATTEPGSFTADMNEKVQGTVYTSKIFVKGEKYRIVQHEDAETLFVLVDQTAGKTRVLIQSQKQYLEIGTQDMLSLMNDPFQSLKYAETVAEKKDKGIDTVSGYECEKYTLGMQDMEMMTYWMSPQLHFPLKIVMHGQTERTIELTDIKVEPLDDSLFVIPEGYTKMASPDEAPIEVPEWAANLDSVPVLTPPAERTMKEGDMYRVKVVSGKAVRVTFENKADSNTSYTVVPFKDSKPISDVVMNTVNFSSEGETATVTMEETPYEADEIVLRVNSGEAYARVETIDVGEGKKVSAGGEYRMKIVPNEMIELRAVNLTDGPAEAVFTNYQNGAELDPEEIGPETYRRLSFSRQYDSRTRTLEPQGDELVVKVNKGELLINAYQSK